ncbi:protein kinase family protein [Hymenobacter siberiensis]|uniref:protein kinase family protein n=1 Tax=Hymenobacter siberiensis TaxID=2848396 RepID=UPI001C1E8659|nr:protein kinase family protein [Hymenobacter siberiensis]MBU6122320.1 protein kinase family protein [Hymenobacter siberiensis]
MRIGDKGSPTLSPGVDDNFVDFLDERFFVSYLSGDKAAEGGNGLVFQINNQNGDVYALKLSKTSRQAASRDEEKEKRLARFNREISALNAIKYDYNENVVGLIGTGNIVIGRNTYDFFVMEKCDYSLSSYLKSQPDLAPSQRIALFSKILNGIKYLHRYGIYHRDIKSDNILVQDDEPKICDLGLSTFRNDDLDLDDVGERIGPTGWFSPEATNKFLVETTLNPFNLNCVIGAKSDVFQLGKLFWYIMQGNLPLGQIAKSDFVASTNPLLYSIIRKCLLHSSQRRPSVDKAIKLMEDLFFEFGL